MRSWVEASASLDLMQNSQKVNSTNSTGCGNSLAYSGVESVVKSLCFVKVMAAPAAVKGVPTLSVGTRRQVEQEKET